MDMVHIYLAGGMGNLSEEEQTKWRRQVKDAIVFGDFDCEKKAVFCDPTQYYSFFKKEQKTQREIFEYDLYNVRKSDLIIVNFNDKNSIGTAMELAIAKEHKIPVIGLNKDNKELHPWLTECCTRICDNMRELVTHVVGFYLN